MDGGRGNGRGLILARLLPGKAGTALGRGQAIAVYDLIASVACPHSLPQALIASGSRLNLNWKVSGPLFLTRSAGALSCVAGMGGLALRTLEPRHFFEYLLSSETVTYSIPPILASA